MAKKEKEKASASKERQLAASVTLRQPNRWIARRRIRYRML